MLDSTPLTNELEPRRQRDLQRWLTESAWWLLSIALHLVLLIALWFSPARQAILGQTVEEAPKPPELTERQARDVAQAIEERASDELRDQVQLLAQTLDEMEQARVEVAPELVEYDQQVKTEGAERAMEIQAEILRQQQEALDSQAPATTRPSVAALEKAQDPQGQVLPKQAEAADLLSVADGADETSKKAQDQARAEQVKANEVTKQAKEEASDAQSAINTARKADDAAEKTEAHAKDLAKKAESEKPATEKATESLASAQAKRNEAAEKVAEAKIELEATKAKASAVAKTDKAAAKSAKAEVEKADRAVKEAAHAVSQADQQIATAKTRLAKADATERKAVDAEKKATAKANDARADATSAQAQATEKSDCAKQSAEKAQSAQKSAKAAQEKAKDALAKSIEAHKAALAAGQTPPAPQTTAPKSISSMDGAQLYDAARDAEKRATEVYRQVRAAELAKIREMPLEKAMAQVDVARPTRPDIDPALLRGEVASSAKIEAQKQAVNEAAREVGSMVGLAQSMLANVRQIQAAQTAGATVAMGEKQAAIEKAASEDESQTAKDMTALMKGGQPSPSASAHAPGSGSPNGAANAGESVALGKLPASPPSPPSGKLANTATARQFAAEGTIKGDWIFISSWYVMGPFYSDTQRSAIDRKFPPETIVDLDAQYPGKHGQPIRWKYVQTGDPMIVPPDAEPWAVYYAYTELNFDRATDTWIAVGSDDYSQIWINDTLVWSSGKQHKSWRIAEGMRKIHFQQGRNRILYRVENGQLGVSFSLSIKNPVPE